ncbi:TIGR02117 family protein [Sphingomonas aracearum]|uniref:TIGR02117 family protein n=2 Tax=Sphingomonas aracearum TaxID=2283317 RepID=A0A369W5S8_9SPHN|nr:TIGR02117 family protein [Sphingomonas aracearum]
MALLLSGYAAAGLIGGSIPVHAGWRPPERGVRIFVESNGVHTGIVVPARAAGVDWSDLVRPSDLRDPRYARYPWRSFGWGERTFYLETPTWSDVRPGTVLAAAFGSDRTLMHVDQVPAPALGSDVRTVLLRPEEYRRLAAFLRASFAPGGKRLPGYGANDAFYEAVGRYSGVVTCNAWTGAALRYAGVRMGAWTPFPVTVLGWLP